MRDHRPGAAAASRSEWKDGAEAYLGIAVPGFPNLFMLYGPNTNLGHNSIVFMIECQVGPHHGAACRTCRAERTDGGAAGGDGRLARGSSTGDGAEVWEAGCHELVQDGGRPRHQQLARPTTVYRRITARPPDRRTGRYAARGGREAGAARRVAGGDAARRRWRESGVTRRQRGQRISHGASCRGRPQEVASEQTCTSAPWWPTPTTTC